MADPERRADAPAVNDELRARLMDAMLAANTQACTCDYCTLERVDAVLAVLAEAGLLRREES